jgi:pimeloyl-ACP methyl ester carboxylesterase
MPDTFPNLAHYSVNESQPSTILLIHGALSSPNEYSLVAPYLKDYHLLVPALPCHSTASSTSFDSALADPQDPSTVQAISFTLSTVAALLANLVRTHGKNQRAHIVGLSLGGHLAIYLAARYPDICLDHTVFASGIALFSNWSNVQLKPVPYFLYLTSVLPARLLPQWLYLRWISMTLDPASPAYGENVGAPAGNMQLCRDITGTLARDQDVRPVEARTLIVAATKKGWMKFPDPIDDARFVVTRMKQGNKESRGIQVKRGSHPWNVQLPSLFAGAVKAWIEGRNLPDGIEDL